MYRFYKIITLVILLFSPIQVNAHLDHYKDLKEIEFDIYRNNQHIGYHIFTFKRLENKLTVVSKIKFKIKKLGIVLYDYEANGTETYKNDKLISFNSKTNQNNKIKYVNIKLENNKYVIDGSSYKGAVPIEYIIGTWWNHSIIKAPAQISAVSGRIIEQKVSFIGKEKIKFGEKIFNALHFNFSSNDKKLAKDKKLNTDVWYDEETLNWVKASFNKKGKWEYRIKSLK